MSDCQYYNLVKKPFENNRMGTENYELSDFDNKIESMTFDQKPLNLKVDRSQSYTRMYKDNLMSTLNHEAKVEYFITKWKTNRQGGISKIAESPSFKIDGHFKQHKDEVMELELSDDGSLVFIIQNHDNLDLKMKIWDVMTLD